MQLGPGFRSEQFDMIIRIMQIIVTYSKSDISENPFTDFKPLLVIFLIMHSFDVQCNGSCNCKFLVAEI